MPELVMNCPHCNSEKVGFDFVGESLQSPVGERPKLWTTCFVCRKCGEGVVVKLIDGKNTGYSPGQLGMELHNYGFEILGTHPKPNRPEVPEHLPTEIEEDFREAQDNLKRGNYRSAGMMFRRTLESATTRMMSNAQGKKLFERIQILAKERVITEAMGDWANVIRDSGNAATHDQERYDKNSATQIGNFTRMFLIYSFTLPKQVKDSRSQSENPAP